MDGKSVGLENRIFKTDKLSIVPYVSGKISFDYC